ncbi:MAG: hypothetical protein NTY35_08980, partial [Planctomycetota bacterium]|nr:hypothetical protein [Planctomycetota bacterium]
MAQKERERANLVAALAQGGPAGLAADIERVDADLATLDATALGVRDELAMLRAHQIDEGELRR